MHLYDAGSVVTMLNLSAQRGVSMVELLVALALSSFLMLGLTQVYLAGKRSDLFRQAQAAHLENSRFAIMLLNELLSKAGYRHSPAQSIDVAFPKNTTALAAHCAEFSAGAVITKLKSVEGGQTGFCLRYQPAIDGELMCDGNRAVLSSKAPLRPAQPNEMIYVAVKFIPQSSVLEQGALYCITQRTSAQLMEGIADMRIEFAVGDLQSIAGTQGQERKLRESNPFVPANTWNHEGVVLGVRYSLLLASAPFVRDGAAVPGLQQWLAQADANAAQRLVESDHRRTYQQVSSLQTLRNRLP